MAPYYLAKIVEWAETLRTRKRLQKVVYLLQAAGCKAIDVDFILHHYGPYSAEVAALSDQMVTSGFLQEEAEQNQVGISYSYQLTETARQAIKDLEHGPHGHSLAAPLKQFETRARGLLKADLYDLEYGATIVYFFEQTKNWNDAVSKACTFKKLQPESQAVDRARKLARSILD